MTTWAPRCRSAVLASSGALLLVVTAASCGSGTPAAGGDGGDEAGLAEGGGEGGTSGDAATDAPAIPLADAPFACGASTCRVDQFCLQPCCGGPAPACIPANDAGGCPNGFHAGFCQSSGTQGCEQDACVPPPASCVDDPKKGGVDCEQRGSSRYLMCLCA